MKKLVTAFAALGVLAAFSTTAIAQDPLEYKVTVYGGIVKGAAGDHFVTIPEPMQLPDVTLRPGTYIFKAAGPSVIQVLSTDRSFVYTMFFTSPTPRPDGIGEYAFTVRPRGKTAALVTKMFLGEGALGLEPIYGSNEARATR